MKLATSLLMATLSLSCFAQSTSDIEKAVNEAYDKFKGTKDGKNADYIPALKEVKSELFGIVVVTPDGQVISKGDTDYEFSIQSISKVFTMAKVMDESGGDKILNSVGVDATGEVFNSINAVERHQGKEINSMVNPGAIATTSMIKGKNADEIWGKIIGTYSDFAGRKLSVNEPVYKSESESNQRNQSLGKLMEAYGLMEHDVPQTVDLYTRQCSVNVNAKDLAMMAATLSNGGFNPVTKKQVIDQKHIKHILAVMSTAGLYDDSGKWLYSTGLPAKSGVGGGIIAVSPGRLGVAAFSPRLDEAGNSVRAQKAIAYITEKLSLNPYDVKAKKEVAPMAEEAEEVK